MSPELLDPESFGLKKICPTKESDCYALGMVIYEVLSGLTPFAPSGPPLVIRKVLDGERPPRPQEEGSFFTDGTWRLVNLCWRARPGDRASAKDVLRDLEGNPSALRPTPGIEGDGEVYTDDQSDTTENESWNKHPHSSHSYPPNSHSCMFFRRISIDRRTFNHCHVVIDMSTAHKDKGPLAPRRVRSFGVASSTISLDSCQPRGPPRNGSSKRRRVGRLALNARRMFKAVARGLHGLRQAKRPSLRWVESVRRV